MSKPYVFINDRMQSFSMLKHRLNLNGNAAEKFDVLNAHFRNLTVLPGQIVVVGDDSTRSCTGEEAQLMHMATGVKQALTDTDSGGDDFMVQNYDFLQSLLGNAAIGIGSATGAWSNHLNGVKDTLDEISELHKQSLNKGTSVSRNDFLSKRQMLFSKLDGQLKSFARYGSGLRNERTIKKMLGISTKSYLHGGQIKGYTDTVKGVARTANVLKKGTAVGIALDTVSTGLEIQEACSTGREEQCTKAKYVEGSKLIGNVAGGAVGGVMSSSLCLYLAASGPLAIGCFLVAGGVSGFALGSLGADIGEHVGEKLYEH